MYKDKRDTPALGGVHNDDLFDFFSDEISNRTITVIVVLIQ